ncbi:MAG: hypothetical protein C0596_09575 [Marinilabiliales bacterium]|nr:MAG: hypothetical protein C0596_09575 [Marinilabiliales bacterium]
MKDVLSNLIIFMSIAVIIPIIVILINFKYIKSFSTSRVFALYSIADLISWFFSIVLAMSGNQNIIVANVFTIVEFTLVSLFFVEILKLKKKRAYVTLICFLSLFFIFGVFISNNDLHTNLSSTVISIIFISLSVIYFSKLMREQKIDNLLSYQNFWFNTGILVYFSGSIFIMIFSNYFFTLSIDAQKILWLLHSIINLICYVIFAIGFYKCKPKAIY